MCGTVADAAHGSSAGGLDSTGGNLGGRLPCPPVIKHTRQCSSVASSPLAFVSSIFSSTFSRRSWPLLSSPFLCHVRNTHYFSSCTHFVPTTYSTMVVSCSTTLFYTGSMRASWNSLRRDIYVPWGSKFSSIQRCSSTSATHYTIH